MRQNILFLFIFLLIGCGAQNNPNNPNSADEETRVPSSSPASLGNNSFLPPTIHIPFPVNIDSSINLSFNEDIAHIKKVETILLKNHSLLEQNSTQIIEKCEKKRVCHIEATATLGAIDFIKYDNNQTQKYQLSLVINQSEKVSFVWSENSNDVTSTYVNSKNSLSLNYLNAHNQEAMIVKDTQIEVFNHLIVTKKGKSYHLTSNHIRINKENFSSNILLEDEVTLEYNENIYPFESIGHNLKDGSYVLLPSNSDIEVLSLIDILEQTVGTFSIWNGEFQGFLYSDEFLNNLDELRVVDLTNQLTPIIMAK